MADWGLTNGQGYIFNRGRSHAAACRLNLQYYLWKDALKFNIDPSIQSSLPQNAAIADVAAGCGIWLVDVSRQLPQAQLDGFGTICRETVYWLDSAGRLGLSTLRWFPFKSSATGGYGILPGVQKRVWFLSMTECTGHYCILL